jgi:hypothetical protein
MERLTVAKPPTADSIATELTVPERLLLFCLATNTDWQEAGVTHATAQHLMVRGLIGARRRAVLAALPTKG